MRNREKVIFLSADHLDEQAAARVREAAQLPPGEARQHALKNAAQLRSYAELKRLLTPERATASGKPRGPSHVRR
jgi:hypothetical protein